MTRELFREDAYLRSCTTRVLAAGPTGIVLEATVFYPEGGGQPGDRGVLEQADGSTTPITDTRKGADGAVLHLPAADAPLPAVGSLVTARLDWELRHRHMRMHTCLHLLCALIPHPVTGGAIASDKGRLDFDMDQGVDKAALETALRQLIAADHPFDYRTITDADMAANMELVRTMSVQPPMGSGHVRLVEIAAVDLQPCGGTHVARTGEIGAVTIGKIENKGKHNRRVNVLFAPG